MKKIISLLLVVGLVLSSATLAFANENEISVYVEGQKGLISLMEDQIVFRVKNKIVSVYGKDLKLKEMSLGTLSISGEIDKIEVN